MMELRSGFALRMACQAVAVCLFAMLPAAGFAADVVFKVRAVNPSEAPATLTVSSKLPKGITPENIVDLGGMELKYDARDAVYRVEAQVELAPGEPKDYEVILKDIWQISRATTDMLKDHAAKLAAGLNKQGGSDATDIAYLKEQIDTALATVADRQTKYDIPNVRVQDHILAFEKSRSLFERARRDIGILEEMAVARGIDTGPLYGPLPPLSGSSDEATAGGLKPIVLTISISNPGSFDLTNAIRRYLPSEVSINDVSPGESGLEVRYDAEKQACYVFGENVAVASSNTRVFEVLISNRWVISALRLDEMEKRATNIQAVAATAVPGVKNEADSVVTRLKELRAMRPPEEFNDMYIASYRKRLEILDGIEGSILRLEELLMPKKRQPSPKLELPTNVKPPTRKTTWILIYIILGFVGLVSLLFFLRWYGKSKDEEMGG